MPYSPHPFRHKQLNLLSTIWTLFSTTVEPLCATTSISNCDRPSAPQAYQCLLSHLLATLGAQEKADCTSMLSSIDSCQNRVSADQYHLTVSRAQVSTHQGRVFFWSYPLTIYLFWNDCRLTFTFLNFIWNILCLCQYHPALLRFWF